MSPQIQRRAGQDCSVSPCDLCLRRAAVHGLFVAEDGGTYVCDQCIPLEGIDVNDPNVNVWENGSDGWLSREGMVCRVCSEHIDVELRGESDEDRDNGIFYIDPKTGAIIPDTQAGYDLAAAVSPPHGCDNEDGDYAGDGPGWDVFFDRALGTEADAPHIDVCDACETVDDIQKAIELAIAHMSKALGRNVDITKDDEEDDV